MIGNHKVTVGISPTPDVLNPQCSCSECDSISCFVKRQPDEQHSCGLCKGTKSCLLLPKNKPGSINFGDKKTDHTIENTTREVVKKEIVYELDKNNQLRIISKKQSRISYEAVGQRDIKEDKNNVPARTHSAIVAGSHTKASPSAGELAAQIMDLPYKKFQKSVSKPNFPCTLPNLSPFDIINRIKEAYKACSCKVCECIAGKSLPNDHCKCKPCECNDCVKLTRNVNSFTNGERLLCPKDNEGCPCIRCNRSSCKGIGEKKNSRTQICDCVGMLQCDYFNRNDYLHACNCEPCQCIECNPKYIQRHRTMIVAPVGEDSQRRVCECTPCECFSCGQGYGPPSNQRNEVSTSVNRHPQCHCEMCLNEACVPDGNLICTCERQSKVMSKPFQQDSHDYDIRRAAVTYREKNKLGEDKQYDTIAMFAAIANTYPKREIINVKQCDCNECECLVCKYKERTENSSKLFRPIRNYEKTKVNNCKCSICECQYCTQHSDSKKNKVCRCDFCDCLMCDDFASSIESDNHGNKKVKTEFTYKQNCKCEPCECVECDKLMSNCNGDICLSSNSKYDNGIKHIYSNEVIYPVKRGEKLTPSIYRSKLKDSFIESCISTLESNDVILKHPLASSQNKLSATKTIQEEKTQNDNLCDIFYQKYFQENEPNHHIAHNFQNRTETVKHAQISKCANLIDLHSRNIEPALESNFSAHSSMTFPRDSGTITPLKCKLKSWESSCNSSGHDYPSYLIHFPKTTVETCLNDVMHYDTENDLDTLTVTCSKNSVRRQKNKDLNANYRIQPKGPPIRSVFSYENPTIDVNSQSQINEINNFKYTAHNFENHPYRLQSHKTSHNMVIPPKPLPLRTVLYPTDINIQSQVKDRNYCKYSAKSFENNFNRPENFKSNFNNIVSKSIVNGSISVDKNGYPIQYAKHSSSSKKNNFNSIDEDYRRAQKTLQEAREFSFQLLRLLDKYEKANQNFESVSEKIKKSEVSLQTNTPQYTNDKTKLIDSFDINDVPTKEQPQKICDSSKEEFVTINKTTKDLDEIQVSKGFDHISENKANASKCSVVHIESEICNANNEGRDESGDNIIQINEFLNTITEEKEPADVLNKQDKKRRVVTKLHKSFNKLYKRTIGPNRAKSFTNSSNVEVDATIGTKTNNNQVPKVKPIEQPNNININQENTNGNFSKAKSLLVNRKVDALKTSTTELRVPETEKYSKNVSQKDVIMIKHPIAEDSRNTIEINNEEPWPILKKNFCLDNAKAKRRFPLWTELEIEVKAATKAISKQRTNENATYLYENKALTKLHSEVKKLLDMPILKTLKNTITGQKDVKDVKVFHHNCLSNTSSQTYKGRGKGGLNSQGNVDMTATVSKNSCNAMKVNYLNVRRVSDHTILVKWDTPRDLNNVVGYELLVDGRAVQRILSPSRRLAVLTCLPHNDKVLLTVRTVVHSPCSSHSPAVTIIYQPKH